jgi:hypothetical protein
VRSAPCPTPAVPAAITPVPLHRGLLLHDQPRLHEQRLREPARCQQWRTDNRAPGQRSQRQHGTRATAWCEVRSSDSGRIGEMS